MGQSILDGFERGFNMMERHNARTGRDNRLARMDEQNENRYNDQQARQTDIDEQNKNRYQDKITRQKTMDNSNLKANQSRINLNDFKLKKAKKDDDRATDQGNAQRAWDYADKNNGKLDPSFKPADEDNAWFFPGYEFEKGFTEKVDSFLSTVNDAREKGNFSLINTPENMARLKTILPEIFKVGENEIDSATGKRIVKKDPLGVIPAKGHKGAITLGLTVTYEDGTTLQKPRSNLGSSLEEDGPRVYDLKGMMGEMMTRNRLAEFQQNPEKFHERWNSATRNANKVYGAEGDKINRNKQKAYRKEAAAIEANLAKAIAKVQGNSDFSGMPDEKKAAINQIKATFQQRKDALNQSYGIETPPPTVTVKYTPEQTKALEQAKAAISGGVAKEAVAKRLLEMGLTEEQVAGL